MDHSLLVSMLNSLAHLYEEIEPFTNGQAMSITMIGNRDALNVLHDKVGSSFIRASSLKYLGDVRVIHQSECLSLRLKAGHDLFGVHAALDQLERNPAANRRFLLSLVHLPHSALTDLLE
jgi:hypothetical protein